MLTNYLPGDEVTKHLEESDFEATSDRASKSLTINEVRNALRGDYWTIGDQCVVRAHVEPRGFLCNPYQCRVAPQMNAVTSTRVTHGASDGGTPFVKQDNWICKATRDLDLGRWWVGRTVFIPTIDETNFYGGERQSTIGTLCSSFHVENAGCIAMVPLSPNQQSKCEQNVVITTNGNQIGESLRAESANPSGMQRQFRERDPHQVVNHSHDDHNRITTPDNPMSESEDWRAYNHNANVEGQFQNSERGD